MMEKVKVNRINSALDDSYDVFLCSASFEERCKTIPFKLKNKKIKKVILFQNKFGSELVINNASELKNKFAKITTTILVDFSNFNEMVEVLVKELSVEKGKSKLSALVDITTFTHEELLVCMKVLLTSSKVKKICCVYNNAKEYCAGVEMSKKWLSQGAIMAHPVLGYSGMILPGKKNHLVVITGYEYSRALSAISDIDPSSISLIYGSSSSAITEKDKEANSLFKNMVQEMAFEYTDIEEYDIPCNNPDEISDGLKKIYDNNKDKNIIILPLNSKMSTLGVIKSVLNNDEPQVCYAPAVVYNEYNYSIPGDECYIYRFK